MDDEKRDELMAKVHERLLHPLVTWKSCTWCGGVGYKREPAIFPGKWFNQICPVCQGRGYLDAFDATEPGAHR